MSYEVRLRRVVGGLGIVAVYKDGDCVAERLIDPRTPRQIQHDEPAPVPYDFGELPLNISLIDFNDGVLPMTRTEWPV